MWGISEQSKSRSFLNIHDHTVFNVNDHDHSACN